VALTYEDTDKAKKKWEEMIELSKKINGE